MMRRSCSVCGGIAEVGSRCAAHPAGGRRGSAHTAAAKTVVAAASACWRCGLPPTADDPLTGDHVIPRSAGGADSVENMQAAHRSCNSRAGAALQQGLPFGVKV